MKTKHLITFTLIIIVSSSSGVPAQTNQTVKVDEGTFVFAGLTITNQKYSLPQLDGQVTNNTNRDWKAVTFKFRGIDSHGAVIESRIPGLNELTFYAFKKGETKIIKDEILSGFYDNKPAAVSLVFAGGEYNATYILSMIKPLPSRDLSFQDPFIQIEFDISKRQIAFVLRNKTNAPIKINWNEVSYIDIATSSHKVMHSGVKYTSRAEPQPSEIVPPTAKLEDIVFPIDYVSYDTEWTKNALFPEAPKALLYKGQAFSVFMPLEINGRVKNYLFTFKILDVQL